MANLAILKFTKSGRQNKMLCNIFHKWSEWQFDAYTYTNKKGFELIVPKQFRYCINCSKRQIREVRVRKGVIGWRFANIRRDK